MLKTNTASLAGELLRLVEHSTLHSRDLKLWTTNGKYDQEEHYVLECSAPRLFPSYNVATGLHLDLCQKGFYAVETTGSCGFVHIDGGIQNLPLARIHPNLVSVQDYFLIPLGHGFV